MKRVRGHILTEGGISTTHLPKSEETLTSQNLRTVVGKRWTSLAREVAEAGPNLESAAPIVSISMPSADVMHPYLEVLRQFQLEPLLGSRQQEVSSPAYDGDEMGE